MNSPSDPVRTAAPVRRTLPPPEWQGREGPRSAASLALQRYELDAPVPHRMGPRADLAAQNARLASASAQGDEAQERVAAASLARALSARGTELESATRLGRRSLLLGEDPVLREELAGWFASLGEPSLAAITLRPLTSGRHGPDAASLWMRVATLLGRAGDAEGQREALARAAAENPEDALPLEQLGALAAWAPGVVPPEAAAQAYLDAAERRERLGEKSGAFEDLLRALEMSPEYPPAADRLALALISRGRVGAADEVRRAHARSLGEKGAPLNERRMRDAIKENDLPRALGAAFDANLDAELDLKSALSAIERRETESVAPAAGFDELLEQAGLHELLAARLELACDLLAGRERARARLALGRMYTGPLGRPERAVDAWIEALVADPGSQEAKAQLAAHAAATRDYAPLVEALIRVGESPSGNADRAACLRELVVLAEERRSDPGLALWAQQRLLKIEREDEQARVTAQRLSERSKLQDDVLASARASLAHVSGAERVEALSRIVAVLEGRPDEAEACLGALLELSQLAPEERAFQVSIERILARKGRYDALETHFARLAKRAGSGAERARLRLSASIVRRRRGDLDGALAELEPLVDEPGAHAAAWSMALLLAAQRGLRALRARAMLRLTAQLAPPFRAVLSSVAAELLLIAGDLERARSAADQACHADPSRPRPVAARALVGLAIGERWGAEAMERAMGVIVPRAVWCKSLARIYATLDEPVLSLAFTQRALALRPGDAEAARERLIAVTRAGDAARLADTLAWLLSQPQPLSELSDLIGGALRELCRLDPGRAGGVSRRALDVIGPRAKELREAVLLVADETGERGLGIAVIERWLATSSAENRLEVLLDLARRRRAAGDADGAARALLRAVREGAAAELVGSELLAALPPKTSDGELALLEARAETLSGSVGAEQAAQSQAWREVGAAYFDLAGDAPRAIKAWERAMSLNPERGVECFASDMVSFAGSDDALRVLLELAKKRQDKAEAARILAVASTVAMSAGQASLAFDVAAQALELDSSRADVLAVAERTAGEEQVDTLAALYTHLAESALGRYGERAVHYRAARQFEKRGSIERALSHAVCAFEAVPSEGVAFVTMARLAERSQQSAEVVRALERVAQRSPQAETRAGWLRRAALFAGPSEEGMRQRVEVLLRALSVRAEVDLVRSLGEALRALLTLNVDDRDILELRFERALQALLRKVEGPEGARIGIECASAALVTFGSQRIAFTALERAMRSDADLEEYASLFDDARLLAASPEHADPFVAGIVDLAGQKFGGAGAQILELAARIAGERGDRQSEAKLLVHAAKKDPENLELVRRAEAAAHFVRDPALLEQVLEAIPVRERVSALLAIADAAEQKNDHAQAMQVLERARGLEGLASDVRAQIFERLAAVLRRTGRRDELELALEAELADAELTPAARARIGGELAALISARGDPERGLGILDQLLAESPRDEALLGAAVALARQANNKPRLAASLDRLAEITVDVSERVSLLREVAELFAEHGEEAKSLQRWQQVMELEPNDSGALGALERDAERRSDYESLVTLLSRRAALASMVDDVRRIRLRRATVLEQRLGRADEARSELEALIAATGDNLSVLRVLADLNERLGAHLRAAPLWLRASAVAQDRAEAADLSRRACEAYLAGDDVESAHRVLEAMGAWAQSPKLLEFVVAVERRRQNPASLAEALTDLATVSEAPPEQRAAWLVEAARATLAAGRVDGALDLATRAARLAPEAAAPQVLARYLEYLTHGPGDAADARVTTAELRGIRERLTPEDAELRAFLIAESLDVALTGEAGLRELERALEEHGERPLIALGLAERMAQSNVPQALAYFDVALGGDLRGVRQRGKVALAAGKLAAQSGQLERAQGYFALAAGAADSREEAQAESRRLLAGDPRTVRGIGTPRGMPAARAQSPWPAPPPSPEETAQLPPAPRISSKPVPAQNEDSLPVPSTPPSSPRMPRANPTPNPAHGMRSKVSGRYSAAPPAPERLSPGPMLAAPPISPGPMRAAPPISSIPPTAASPMTSAPISPPPASPRGLDSPRQTLTNLPGASAHEEQLFNAMNEGSLDAGLELMKQLEHRTSRAHELVSVCRRVAYLKPGDAWAIGKLYEAALADRDLSYARAVEHVLAIVAGDRAPSEPPPLADQAEQPDAVRSMLFRDGAGPVQEALSLVWEGAEHVFRRDPSTYGVTGLERVPLTAPTPLARVYASVARAFALTRAPLFQRRSAGAITVNLALLSPPAVILSGDVRQETAELRYHLGAMLAATIPQYVLLFGSPESQARAVLKGLGFAFGPPQAQQTKSGGVLNLAEVLWESIPARYQRRLRELCHAPEALDYDVALGVSRNALRRAGLFAAGDLAVALTALAAEEGFVPERLAEPNGVAELCATSASARSLLSLALSPEFAHARWQTARAGSPRH